MQFLNYFKGLPLTDWEHFGVLLFAAVCIGLGVELVKHNRNWKDTDHKMIVATLGLLSFTVTWAGQVSDFLAKNPALLGRYTVMLTGLATLVYHFGGSNQYKKVTGFLDDLDNYLTTGELPGVVSGQK